MHPEIFSRFNQSCEDLHVTGPVLEIGASPNHGTLLDLPALDRASLRIGVGLDGAFDDPANRYRIICRDAHDLRDFADESFDLVLSNSMLEHDPRFWLTLAEARRVTKSGGWLGFGVPGFIKGRHVPGHAVFRLAARVPFLPGPVRRWCGGMAASTPVLHHHAFPLDCFRFGDDAMRHVILDGLEDIRITNALSPPRIIGFGRKPDSPA
jgi:SAM-dependent methyltransferase